METTSYHRALTIAGSDSGGGAGIQADLKTFSALGCYGMSVITALTAQNTVAVTGIHGAPPAFVAAQIDAVLSDIGVDAVKIGMLASPEVIEVVAERLRHHRDAGAVRHVVLDPVMVAKSGDALLQENAIAALREALLPQATVLTPNLPEAEVLLGERIRDAEGMEAAARALLELGPRAVLLKGGHFGGASSDDCFATAQELRWLRAPRTPSKNTHGTGCTLSSAIAAFLAHGESVATSVEAAKRYISAAIAAGAERTLGEGHGPVHHFHAWW